MAGSSGGAGEVQGNMSTTSASKEQDLCATPETHGQSSFLLVADIIISGARSLRQLSQFEIHYTVPSEVSVLGCLPSRYMRYISDIIYIRYNISDIYTRGKWRRLQFEKSGLETAVTLEELTHPGRG